MTFAEFCAGLDLRPMVYGKPDSVARLVFERDVPMPMLGDERPNRWDMYHLDDFHVSSVVSGPGYVLVPRSFPERCTDCGRSIADPYDAKRHGIGSGCHFK